MSQFSFKNREGVVFVGQLVDWMPAVENVFPRQARLFVPGFSGFVWVPVAKLRPVRSEPNGSLFCES